MGCDGPQLQIKVQKMLDTSVGGPGSATLSALPPSSGGTGRRWKDWTYRSRSSSAASGMSRDSRRSRSISGRAKGPKQRLSLAGSMLSSIGFRRSKKSLTSSIRAVKTSAGMVFRLSSNWPPGPIWSGVRIDPFRNGNGRTARILTNAILMPYGLPPVMRQRLRPRQASPTGYAGAVGMEGNAKPMEKDFRKLLMDLQREDWDPH